MWTQPEKPARRRSHAGPTTSRRCNEGTRHAPPLSHPGSDAACFLCIARRTTHRGCCGRNGALYPEPCAVSDQRWILEAQGNGWYELKSLNNPGLNRQLSGAGTTSGTPMTVGSDTSGSIQRWKLDPAGDGYYRLTPQHAPGTYLDLAACEATNGTAAQIWSATDCEGQLFRLDPVAGVANGVYRLTPKHAPGSALDVNACGGAGTVVAATKAVAPPPRRVSSEQRDWSGDRTGACPSGQERGRRCIPAQCTVAPGEVSTADRWLRAPRGPLAPGIC